MASQTQPRSSGSDRPAGHGESKGERPAGRTDRHGHPREGFLARWPDLLASLFAVIAAICVVLALIEPLRSRAEPVQVASEYLAIPIRPNLAYAAFLGLLAGSLRRRTRVSWWFVVIFYFGLSFLGSFLGAFDKPLLFISAAILLPLLVVTIAARRQFTARLQRGNGWRALGALVLGLAIATALGFGLVMAFPGTLTSTGDRLGWAVDHVFGGLGAAETSLDIVGRPPGIVTFLCGLFGAVAFLWAAWVLFRPRRGSELLTPGQEVGIRQLLAVSGERDSLGYFATRRDKSAIFSPSGKSAVTYRVVGGTSLASGDPIGDPEAWGPAIDAWLEEAVENAWAPGVLGASEEGALAYQRAGLSALSLGDEAILYVADFELDGRAMRGVRQAVHRVEKSGYRCTVRRHRDLSPGEMAGVLARADAWRDTETERGFSMALGRLGDPADGDCVLAQAIDDRGELRAVLSLVPWGARGLSLDLMRRDRDADNGLVEFMVTALVQNARRLGIERISLNFAMFRAVFSEGGRIGAGPVLRLVRSVLIFFSRWWQLESLYRSNAKYRPLWEQRLLCYRSSRDLARISVAMGIAEGFVSVPSAGALFRRGHREPEPPAAVEPRSPVPESTVEDPAVAVDEYAALPEQMRVRRHKLDRLRAAGVDPYPVGYPRTSTVGAVVAGHQGLATDTRTGQEVAVTGRVVLNRATGKLCFATITEGADRIQLMLSADRTGPARLSDWVHDIDLGDHVGVRGEVVTSKRGELSIAVDDWTLTAKCLRPLPDKHRGLQEPEARVRLRHVDLITNPEAREQLRLRSRAIAGVREFLIGRDFLEVETPILQRIHGGANARPFVTHINAYDLKLYLRIAPELFLKRLMVGGEPRVFELNRNFRNEGADATHNPEFTMLEAYEAYGDYTTMLDLAREMIQHAATRAYGSPVARRADPEGHPTEYDLSGQWRIIAVNDAIAAALGEPVDNDTPVEQLLKYGEAAGLEVDPQLSRGAVIAELYDHFVEARTVEPTFYRDFPTEVSPLTRQHRVDPRMAERWDLVAFGAEIGTAYSELIDPVEQRARLTAQSLLAARGDPEAMELDEEFLSALEYAMPPTGGLGMGVDRLIIMLTGRPIRDTILFPLVRPQS